MVSTVRTEADECMWSRLLKYIPQKKRSDWQRDT